MQDGEKDDGKFSGTIKFFNKEKGLSCCKSLRSLTQQAGYGFATLDDGREAYIHQSNVVVMSGKEVKKVEDKCFEPPDHVKGDLARAYFYISAWRYDGQFKCCRRSVVDGNKISKNYEDMLRSAIHQMGINPPLIPDRTWHKLDPVSESERQRNEKIYKCAVLLA
eukprot:381888-Hanusia_phi.AAC.2